MAPKKAKKEGGGSAEKEAALRAEQEQFALLEKQAERIQQQENEKRDRQELRESELWQRQKLMAAATIKDDTIQKQADQMEILQKELVTMKEELAGQLDQAREINQNLSDELSQVRIQAQQDAENAQARCDKLEVALSRNEEELKVAIKETEEAVYEATHAKDELAYITKTKLKEAEEVRDQAKAQTEALEGELEKTQKKLASAESNIRTLHSAMRTREDDDKKNVLLVEMLKKKNDESQESYLKHMEMEAAKLVLLQEENIELQRKVNHVQCNLEEAGERIQDLTADWKQEVKDWEAKYHKSQFDTKYIHTELQVTKEKLRKLLSDSETADTKRPDSLNSQVLEELGAAASGISGSTADPVLRNQLEQNYRLSRENRHLRMKLEQAQEAQEKLDAMLKRREKEHLDRNAQLNVQISTHRTTITQLQQRIAQEKETRIQAVAALTEEVDNTMNTMMQTKHEGDSQRMTMARMQAKLQSEVATMRASIFELQAAVVQKERTIEDMTTEKERTTKEHQRHLLEAEMRFKKAISESNKAGNAKEAVAETERMHLLEAALERAQGQTVQAETARQGEIASLTYVIAEQTKELRTIKEHYEARLAEVKEENTQLKAHLGTQLPTNAPEAYTPWNDGLQ